MPTPLMKKYQKQSGQSMQQVEECWEKSKKKAKHAYEVDTNEYWAMVNKETRKCLGIDKK